MGDFEPELARVSGIGPDQISCLLMRCFADNPAHAAIYHIPTCRSAQAGSNGLEQCVSIKGFHSHLAVLTSPGLTSSKDIMVQNIDSILQRGERLDLLVDKTDTLAGQAYAFRRGARNVRRQQWWKNMRIMALTGVVGVVSHLHFIFAILATVLISVNTVHPHRPILRSVLDPLPRVELPRLIP